MVASDSWTSEKQNKIRVSRYKAHHVQLVGVINNLLLKSLKMHYTLQILNVPIYCRLEMHLYI